jgi:hypothetical protein
MVNSYSFINIIDNEFYKILEEFKIEWYEHSLHKSGRNIIVEKDWTYFYTNSNVKKVYSIEDIRLTLQKIESTPYRSPILKEQELTNYRTIYDALLKHERQKKLTLILND